MSRISRLTNAVPMLVLHSPAHRVMSGRYAVIEFTGRRSGRTYRTVVGDEAEAAEVLRQLVERVPGYSRPAGVRMSGGRVSAAELARAVTSGGSRSIEVRLEGPR